ncbi:MAG: hypothetical protein COA86_12220 [Kangiella sp.]|nr:MAG: hypothetical protein COA86_12220 [Kangiella sp.]
MGSSLIITVAIAEAKESSTSLTRQQIIAFKSVTHKMGLLNAEYPELAEHSQQFDFDKSEQVVTFLKKSKAYPKIEAILQNSEIDDLREVFKISQKVMGGLYFLNRKKDDTNQSESQFETIRKVILANLARLEEQSESGFDNNNERLIKEMKEQLALLDEQLIIVKQAIESLNDVDKIFLDKNAIWFKQQFAPVSNR